MTKTRIFHLLNRLFEFFVSIAPQQPLYRRADYLFAVPYPHQAVPDGSFTFIGDYGIGMITARLDRQSAILEHVPVIPLEWKML
jgi:hypothetical protein